MVITVYISNEAQSMSPDALNSIMVITVFPSIFIFCKLFFPLNSIMVITVSTGNIPDWQLIQL